MTKKQKPDEDLDFLELDAELPPVQQKKEEKKKKDPDSYEAVLERLTAICKQEDAWLSIPVYREEGGVKQWTGEYGVEVGKCTPEEFVKWLDRFFPAHTTLQLSLKDYDSETARVAYIYVVARAHELLATWHMKKQPNR